MPEVVCHYELAIFRPIREVVDSRLQTRWELHPVEAHIARQMFRLSVEENLGYKGIGDRLTQMGFPGRKGRPIASFTLQRVLVRVPRFFPAGLFSEEWQRLQERLSIRRESSRGRTNTSEYLLSGIACCGQCGCPMVGKKAAAYKRKQYRNYLCSRAIKTRSLWATYNAHSASRMEKAGLEIWGSSRTLSW